VEIGSRKTGDIRPNLVIFPLLPWFPISFRSALTFASIIPAFRGDTNLQVSSLRFRVPSPRLAKLVPETAVPETCPRNPQISKCHLSGFMSCSRNLDGLSCGNPSMRHHLEWSSI